MRSQLISLLGADIVNRISAVAQLLALIVGALGYYQSKLPAAIARALPILTAAKNMVRIGADKTGFVALIGSPARLRRIDPQDLPISVYLVLSGLAFSGLLLTERSVLYWVAYPFLQLYHAGAVWRDFSLHWHSFLLPLYSVGLLLWALVSMLLLYVVAFGALLKTAVVAVEHAGKWLTAERINLLLFLTFLLSGALALLTSVDF